MTNYRRMRVAGGTYFFTVKLCNPKSRLLVEQVGALRAAFRTVMTAHPFVIDAIVIMPNHLHTLWTLPPEDCDYSTRWRQIKAAFSRAIPKGERMSASRQAKGERGIWQRQFWEHTVRDQRGFNNRFHYIHPGSPLKWSKLSVATCKHPRSDLQTSRFSAQISCK